MAILLKIDEDTTVEMEPSHRTEGETAGTMEDVQVKIEDIVDLTKKILGKIKDGLRNLGPDEIELELGFSGGHNFIVISGQGSIKVTAKWKT